jgi:thymidylate synthase
LNLLKNILENGNNRGDRTKVGTRSLFGQFLQFNLNGQIPLLTTKKMAWKTCIRELLWFCRGETDSKILERDGVNIWKGNSSREFLDSVGLSYREGDIGPLYGFAWRHYGAEYIDCDTDYSGKGIDQIAYIEYLLKNDPESRRIMMTSWNPTNFDQCALLPCHVFCQFYVENKEKLSCHIYMRSADCFLGLPFNIFSYSVLTYLLAHRCNLTPDRLNISIGDAHIYQNHFEQVSEQIKRIAYPFPKFMISSKKDDIDWKDYQIEDFHLLNYDFHPLIKAPMNA